MVKAIGQIWRESGDAVIAVRKLDGVVLDGIEAQFCPGVILIMDATFPLSKGDMLIRTLPSGLRVGLLVEDPGYHEAIGRLPARFEVKTHCAAPIDTREPSDYWRRLRTEFEQFSETQRRSLGVNRDHTQWMSGFCSRRDDSGDFAYCSLDGGLDSEFRSKVEDTVTRAALALGGPPGADVIEFWVACLGLDLLQNGGEATPEMWHSVPEGGFIHDFLSSSAAYSSRLAAMADRNANAARSAGGRMDNPAAAVPPTSIDQSSPEINGVTLDRPAVDVCLDLLQKVLDKKAITIETWARDHNLGRSSVFDWKAGRIAGITPKGKVSPEKSAVIEAAVRKDALELGLTARTDSD